MNNHDISSVRGRATLTLAAALMALAASCSSVFTASILGTVIDREQYDDGNTVGVTDARVFLYTDERAWNDDYAAYVEGNESTLPDSPLKEEYRYFQSTETDANGEYQFSGFIWHTLFPAFGKTADRREVYLLVYHPDYGLWKNATPLFVVSDVTSQVDTMRVLDLWNQGVLSGSVDDWADGEGLANVTVAFYVAESWNFDGVTFKDVEYPRTATTTVTTDGDGLWSVDLTFPIRPTRALDQEKAPVRITFSRTGWRANDPADGTDLSNAGIGLVVDTDLDRDGRTPGSTDPDYADAFLAAEVEIDDGESVIVPLPPIMMQRWSFSVRVAGKVTDGATPPVGINGAKVTLLVPDTAGTEYIAYSEQQTIGETTEDGNFSLGTIAWELSDIVDADARKTGVIPVALSLTIPDASGDTIDYTPTGDIAELAPDDAVTLELSVSP